MPANQIIAFLQGSSPDEDDGRSSEAGLDLRLDDGSFDRTFRICGQLQDLGLRQDGLDQVPDVGAVQGGDGDGLNVTTVVFELKWKIFRIYYYISSCNKPFLIIKSLGKFMTKSLKTDFI